MTSIKFTIVNVVKEVILILGQPMMKKTNKLQSELLVEIE